MESTAPDTIERLGRSVVQHGKHNDRVYLMRADRADLPGLVETIDRLAIDNNYSKVFAKIRASMLEPFRKAGYRVEATVPGLFTGQEDGLFLGRYFSPERAVERHPEEIASVLKTCNSSHRPLPSLPPGIRLFPLDGRHVAVLADLYGHVFASYPFPIDDAEHLRASMVQNVIYYGALEGERLVAASAAEMDPSARNAEMSDFATHPDARGRGFAGNLLRRMESDMRQVRIRTLYTIARATSTGMNVTFARCGYTHAGTLTSNTQIAGQFESMNVWYRRLSRRKT
jgi:putative beta-lysine N-acetyltransferase